MKTQLIIANYEMVNEARTMLMLATDPSQVELVLFTQSAPAGAKDFTRLVTKKPWFDIPNWKDVISPNYIFLCSPEASEFEAQVNKELGKLFEAYGNISVSKAGKHAKSLALA